MKKSTKKHKKSSNSKYIIGVAVLAVVVLLAIILTGKSPKSTGNTTIDLYVMSQCPYGVQAEDAIIPAVKKFGNAVTLNIDFIGRGTANSGFQSLHGNNEVLGDIAQVCAIKQDYSKALDMISCMNENAGNIPNNWEDCAKRAGLNTNVLKSCYEGSEGKQLLEASFKRADAAGAQGSPTIKINGQDYNGQRDTTSFTSAICKYSSSPICSNLPACNADAECLPKEGKVPLCKNPGEKNAACEYQDDAKTQLTIVNDKRCASCDTTQLVAALKGIFLAMDVKEVDVSSDEGKALASEMGLAVVPAFIFDSNIVNTYAWKSNPRLSPAFESKNGKYRILDAVTGASYYFDEKVRQEFLSSIGVTAGDNKPQIDFFVMSYCPYGNQAEEMIKPIYDNLKDKAQFNPRYVIYGNYQSADFCLDSSLKYCSLHGRQELMQDVRELCVNKYMGIKSWFDFAIAMNSKCNYQNADSCWEAVAKDLSLDTQKIKDCEKNEAETLLAKEKELGDKLGVQGSPTLFVEGTQYGGQRDSNSIQNAMCSSFDTKPSECSNTLAGGAASAAPAAGGCG